MKKIYWFVIILYLGLYILPLPFRPLTIPDEFRYAEIPREMIASGNWSSSHLNGLHYFEKPVMGYWLTAGSLLLFGENALGVRLPSALAAGICALMVFALMRRFHKRSETALLSAFILLTSLEFYALGVIPLLDGPLNLFLTLAMGMFYFAYQQTDPKKQKGFLILFGLFCGLAFMTKGFLALALPVLVMAPFLIWEKRAKELLRFAWLPLLAAGLTVLPWAITIHRSNPDFWHYFFWVEHVQRFFSDQPQHPQPFWYFIPIILAGFLPWSALLPAAVKGSSLKEFKDPLYRFAVCWFVFPLLFFSASHGKLATYILPCFPPLAILCSFGLTRYFETGTSKFFSVPVRAGMILALLLALIVALSQLTGFLTMKVFGAGETWKWVLLCGMFLCGALSMLLSLRSKEVWRRIGFFGIAPFFFMIGSSFILPELMLKSKAPEAFLREQAARLRPDSILVCDDKVVYALCWVFQRDDAYILEMHGELEYGLKSENALWRFFRIKRFVEWLGSEEIRHRVALFIDKDLYIQFASQLPKPTFKAQYGEFVLIQF